MRVTRGISLAILLVAAVAASPPVEQSPPAAAVQPLVAPAQVEVQFADVSVVTMNPVAIVEIADLAHRDFVSDRVVSSFDAIPTAAYVLEQSASEWRLRSIQAVHRRASNRYPHATHRRNQHARIASTLRIHGVTS